VYQSCWGFTTRSIGAMVMIHGDDKGLVLPPMVAEYQVVIVPIFKTKAEQAKIEEKISEITTIFDRRKVRYHIDSTNQTPGWKFNHWEQKGVPIRLEIGPKDIKEESVTIVIRHSGEKRMMKISGLRLTIPRQLKTIHREMLRNTKKILRQRTKKVRTWTSFINHIRQNNLVLIPWCETKECEADVQESSAKNILQFRKRLVKKGELEEKDLEKDIGKVKTL